MFSFGVRYTLCFLTQYVFLKNGIVNYLHSYIDNCICQKSAALEGVAVRRWPIWERKYSKSPLSTVTHWETLTSRLTRVCSILCVSSSKRTPFPGEQKAFAQCSCLNKFRTELTNEQLGRTRMWLVRHKYKIENFETSRAYRHVFLTQV